VEAGPQKKRSKNREEPQQKHRRNAEEKLKVELCGSLSLCGELLLSPPRHRVHRILVSLGPVFLRWQEQA
jgi:hypothetical protein